MGGSDYDEGDQAYTDLLEECKHWCELNDYHISRYNDTVAENNKLLERIELLEIILKDVVDLYTSTPLQNALYKAKKCLNGGLVLEDGRPKIKLEFLEGDE